jgi:tetratricopeptide (TPR) repeat protein
MPPARGRRSPLLRRCAGLLLGTALIACAPADPLEAIRQQQAAGDLAGSLEPLRELLEERRDDPEVLFLYGRALALTGQTSLAEWSLREAMKDPRWRLPAGLQVALGALRTANYEMAIETTGQLLEMEPDNVEALLMRANAYAHSRLHDEAALADVERILELDPANLDAMEPKILALIGLERIEEAGAAIDDLGTRIEEADLGSVSENLPGWHCATAAIFAEESDELERAGELWDDCVERYPGHPNVVGNGVHWYDSRGLPDRSLEILRRASETQPDSRDFRVKLADRLRAAGRVEEAESLMRAATETEHAVLAASAWLDLVKHYQAVGEYGKGADAADRAIELAAEIAGDVSPMLRFEHADALLLAGRLDRALAVADDMSVPAHQEMIRARVAQERGQAALALEHFDEAFQLWPDNPWARYYAALAAESIGDFDRAVDAYRYAIRIAADATDARIRLARLHLAEGRPELALDLLRTKSDVHPLGLEGELLSLRLIAMLGNQALVVRTLAGIRQTLPDYFGPALSHAAQGLAERGEPGAAIRLLRGTDAALPPDLTDPRQVDALRTLVEISREVSQLGEAEASVRAAVRAHPEVAAFHEILGRCLELRGGAAPDARAAYEQALALDPASAGALRGLARLALDSDPAAALAHFERARAADAEEPEALRGAAQVLLAMGRTAEAEVRLEELLRRDPYDADAARRLVELQLERGEVGERSVELAQRAVRFGGGADALELLGRVHERRDEPALASQAEERARALRDQQGG